MHQLSLELLTGCDQAAQTWMKHTKYELHRHKLGALMASCYNRVPDATAEQLSWAMAAGLIRKEIHRTGSFPSSLTSTTEIESDADKTRQT